MLFLRAFLFCVWFLPLLTFAQKVKVNEYDKFIRQQRVELEPLPLLSSEKAKVSLSLQALSNTFYVQLSGFGWGATTIDASQEMIFLFSNDSTVHVKSTGLQTTELMGMVTHYNHRYFISPAQVEALTNYDLVAIRKYDFRGYNDLAVSKESAGKIKKLGALFMSELKKARVLYSLKTISVKDIFRHIGDSVQFCSKVLSTRYFESTTNKPTLLDLRESFQDTLVNSVIWEQDRANFSGPPELIYDNKEVCVSGVVRMVYNIPQLRLYNPSQIRLKGSIPVSDAKYFIGDSVTISGRVFSGVYLENQENKLTVLNVGAAYPNQLLTIVIPGSSRGSFSEKPESFYSGKEVQVSGKIVLYKGQPQVVIQSKSQIKVTGNDIVQAVYQSGVETVSKKEVVSPTKEEVQPETVETTAAFPGGAAALAKFLSTNLVSPVVLEPDEKIKVVVRFVVREDGSLQDFKIMQSAGAAFDREVLRVLKRMPKWIPNKINGQAISATYTQPVTFYGVSAFTPPAKTTRAF